MNDARAAALRYDPADPAPRVLARGIGDSAETLLKIAAQSGVPVVVSDELADALSRIKPFDFIPEQFWIAVAEILRFVYETRGPDELYQS